MWCTGTGDKALLTIHDDKRQQRLAYGMTLILVITEKTGTHLPTKLGSAWMAAPISESTAALIDYLSILLFRLCVIGEDNRLMYNVARWRTLSLQCDSWDRIMSTNNVRLTAIALLAFFSQSGFGSQIGILIGPIAAKYDIELTSASALFTLLIGGSLVGNFAAYDPF